MGGDPSGLQRGDFFTRFFNIGNKDFYNIVNKYIKPYIVSKATVLEIGPGGGGWTNYLLWADRLILVDINDEFFSYLSKTFLEHKKKFIFYTTKGYELTGIESESVDFVFSFSVFVHIEVKGILQYMHEIARVLKNNSVATIQYADKTKLMGFLNPHFSNMTYKKMEIYIKNLPRLKIVEHNGRLLNHSNIIVLQKI